MVQCRHLTAALVGMAFLPGLPSPVSALEQQTLLTVPVATPNAALSRPVAKRVTAAVQPVVGEGAASLPDARLMPADAADSQGAVASVYVSAPESVGWTPYIGAGAGPVRRGAQAISQEWGVGYQFVAGAQVNLPVEGKIDTSSLNLGYRYIGAPGAGDTAAGLSLGTTRYQRSSHNAELSWRLTF